MDGTLPNEAPPVIGHHAGTQFSRLKRFLICLPLLGLPAAMGFLIPYWIGRGFLSEEYELAGFAAFFLPFAISAVFAFLASRSWPKRFAVYIAAFIIQFALLSELPPGLRAELMGMADRCRRDYSVESIRAAGAHLLRENQKGTLRLIQPIKTDQTGRWGNEPIVDDPQLPASLQKRFAHVRLYVNETDIEMVFEIGANRAIVYSTNRLDVSPWFYPVGKEVYVCHYVRL